MTTSAGCEFPPDLHYLVDHQVWARVHADATATVGITALGIRQAGEIYMCRPRGVGSQLEQGRALAVVELAKSIVSVKSPVRGVVVEVNALLETQPERVHRDPYGAGWLARVALTDFEADRTRLVHGDAVAPAMARHAWLMKQDDE
jgi:glycine cleavage system H protein